MILFDSSQFVNSARPFAADLFPPSVSAPAEPGQKRAPFSADDAAYWAGYSAAFGDGDVVYPDPNLSRSERDAFCQGVTDALREVDHEIEEARAATAHPSDADLDAMYSALEVERRGAWGSHA